MVPQKLQTDFISHKMKKNPTVPTKVKHHSRNCWFVRKLDIWSFVFKEPAKLRSSFL